MREILERIRDYRDIADLDSNQLDKLCFEIRELIIETVSENGGHLGSSLGAVELIVSLLRSFDPARDKIIFDVGHQAYAYKILTGRKDRFCSLRKWGGISGFPDPKESVFDHFNAGHSSKSLSASLGFAKARDILGQNHHVVAVIGDGSLMNGMALEALNNTHEAGTRVIYVLNDNQMSISPRVGGMANHLAALSVSPFYHNLKSFLKYFCRKLPRGNRLESFLEKIKQKIKGFLLPPNMFEEIGISYWGPFDGHNIREMQRIFDLARSYEFPLLIHVLTKKGKGFKPAENMPETYHGVSPKKHVSVDDGPKSPCWSSASASCIEDLARKDPRIVCMTAAMKEGSKLNRFSSLFPERFFDVGIAEGHLLTFAAGMASAGMLPVVSIYSTFLQRAMDQLVHDICMQNLPVILAIDRSGLVGEDGETHHGILDVSWCRSIPNLTIMAPRDIPDLKSMYEGAARIMSPCAIRLPRGNAPGAEFRDKRRITAPWGKGEKLFEGSGWALCAYGSTVPLARIVYEEALREGLQPPSIYDLRFLKPMDMDMVREMLTSHDSVIVLEDGHREGGAGEKISAIATEGPYRSRVITMGVPDEFVPHGTVGEQWKYCGLEPEEVIRKYHAITSERTAGPGNGKKRSCGEPDSRAVNDNGWGRGC